VHDGESIVKPKVSDQLDVESELAVIIGRQGRHIMQADAVAYVGGYTCLNEGSARMAVHSFQATLSFEHPPHQRQRRTHLRKEDRGCPNPHAF